jgi:hypothetical protein
MSARSNTWGKFSDQYTYDIVWNGVPLTVEIEADMDDAVTPVRVLAGAIDITDIVDTTHGHLCELLQQAHDNRYATDHLADLADLARASA